MKRHLVWVGAGLILAGLVLGFIRDGECGSVFQGPDYATLLNPPDCSNALDLSGPVWLLLGVGGVAFLVGGFFRLNDWSARHLTADTHDEIPSGNPAP